ncbi:hypothetical protein [Bacillus wiedmannii]|uniref:hypothetical protein n=1 Tax=Bacillus wiedmannii TaxID=1890302 RepID=UPI000BFBA070|nr:hypothetical protein [Bacillus wiedmannii]PHE70494.1 hypothetical protein COF77_25100 [Bacillus wiedmannii]
MCVSNPVNTVCADAFSYGPRATSIDVTHSPSPDTYGWKRIYATNLERLYNGHWNAVETKSGNYRYSVTNSFSLAARLPGTYRLVINYTLYDASGAYHHHDTMFHPTFEVYR